MNRKNLIDAAALRDVRIFEGLEINELMQIAKLCRIVECKKGDKILSRGNNAENLYIIRRGKVSLCFHVSILLAETEIVIDRKQAGDVVGWSALIEPYKLTLSGYCDEDCELLQLRGRDVLSLCRKNNHIGFILMSNLGKVVSSRLDQMQFLCEREIQRSVPSFEGKSQG